MRSLIPAVLCLLITLTACSENGLLGEIDSHGTRFQIRGAASELDCPNGGSVLEYGIDSNANGLLDPVEVNGLEIVCDGANADISLVKLSPEPGGENCTSGGTRVQQGVDTNQNQLLDPEEVLETSYVCDGARGNNGSSSLLSLSDVLPGEACANGGTKIESGTDVNGNNTLDPREVQQTRHVCNGVDGAVGVPSPTNLLESALMDSNENCPAGGHKLTTGLDLNENDLLDEEEIQHTSIVCNGQNGSNGEAAMSCTVTSHEDGTKTLSCPDGTFVTIHNGSDGVDGATGVDGVDGATGATGTTASCTVTDNLDGTATITCSDGTTATLSNGEDAPANTITASIYCTGLLGESGLSFHYTVAQFALGDVFVSGGVWGAYTEVTNATMYSFFQDGYNSAPIFFTYDVLGDDNEGFWQLSLNRETLLTTINYEDPDGNSAWEMIPEDCVVNDYTE